MQGRLYMCSQGETLDEQLARRHEILECHEHAAAMACARQKPGKLPLVKGPGTALDEDDDTAEDTICAL